jgi:hypothetical protein
VRFIIIFFTLLFLYKSNDDVLGRIFKDLVHNFLLFLLKLSRNSVYVYYLLFFSILLAYYIPASIIYYIFSFFIVTLIMSDNKVKKEINAAMFRWKEVSDTVTKYSPDVKKDRLSEFFSFEVHRISRRLLKTTFFDIFMPMLIYFFFGLPLLICLYVMKVIIQNKMVGYKSVNNIFWFFNFFVSRIVVLTFALVGDFDKVFMFIRDKFFSEKINHFKLVYQSFSKMRYLSDYDDSQLIYDYLKVELDKVLLIFFRVIIFWLIIMVIKFLVPL